MIAVLNRQLKQHQEVARVKYPTITHLSRDGSKFYGRVGYGGVGVPFRIEITGHGSVPRILTGNGVLKSQPKKPIVIVTETEIDKVIKRVSVKNTKADDQGEKKARITVMTVRSGGFLVLSQLECKSGWSQQLRVLDPLIGYWLETGRNQPQIATLSRRYLCDGSLKALVIGAKKVRQEHRNSSFWGEMSLEEVMCSAMTGW